MPSASIACWPEEDHGSTSPDSDPLRTCPMSGVSNPIKVAIPFFAFAVNHQSSSLL
ncbi:hypothetical protein F2Q70_00036030 [Brassica cretica]|uniref:Uncharacterized protein n=1 Tax=Brassica cretica TaxID=69181 RepID=A0A8S9K046_BRACR|nr:hypothetical protein F2Q70_00036030 [Brassica cretica]